MAQEFKEPVHVLDADNAVAVELNGGSTLVRIGVASDEPTPMRRPTRFETELGSAIEVGPAGIGRLRLFAGAGTLQVLDASGEIVFAVRGGTGEVVIGHADNAGELSVLGDIEAVDGAGRRVLHVDASNAVLRVGGAGNEGDLIVEDLEGREALHFNGESAFLRVGVEGNEGDIEVLDDGGRQVLHFDGQHAVLRVGGAGNEGDVILRDDAGREAIHLDAGNAVLRVGTAGNEGDLRVHDDSDREVFAFDARHAVLRVGAAGNEGDIICRDDAGNESIHLNGGSGDIILRNADVAEDFEAADVATAPPGTVMVVGDDGRLEACTAPYDRRVVGVVAGAGRYRPGIVLDRQGDRGSRVPVSVMGKVSCRADASFGAIRAGDFLTTSPRGGCAMRATDASLATGAVIGKALSSLDGGEGMVELLISLQ